MGTPAGTAIPGGALADGSTGRPFLYAQGGLYFSNGQVIERLPLSGGQPTTVGYTSASTQSTALSVLAANNSSLFFSDGATIFSTPLPNGNGGPGVRVMDATFGFAVDDTTAYWDAGAVQSCQLANCAGTQKSVAGTTGANEIGIDDTAVYWTVSTFPPGQPSFDAFVLYKVAK